MCLQVYSAVIDIALNALLAKFLKPLLDRDTRYPICTVHRHKLSFYRQQEAMNYKTDHKP